MSGEALRKVHKSPARKRRAGAVGRPRAADAQRRDEAVLQTACDLLLDQGHRAFSLGAVTREAHVAGRTLYARFGGKRGLLLAVVAHVTTRLATRAGFGRPGAPLHSALVEFGRSYLRQMSQPDAVALRRLVLAEALAFPEVAQVYGDRLLEPARAALVSFFGRADVQALLTDRVPAADLADTYLGVVGRYLDAIALGRSAAPADKAAKEWATSAADLFLHGALARPQLPMKAMETA